MRTLAFIIVLAASSQATAQITPRPGHYQRQGQFIYPLTYGAYPQRYFAPYYPYYQATAPVVVQNRVIVNNQVQIVQALRPALALPTTPRLTVEARGNATIRINGQITSMAEAASGHFKVEVEWPPVNGKPVRAVREISVAESTRLFILLPD